MNVWDLTQQTAAELGDGWTATPVPEWGDGGARLTHTDGRGLELISVWTSPDRVEVDGRYPASEHRHERPEITVRIDRGPSVLAREITRRLLPRYTEILAEVIAHNREAEKRQARTEALTARLGARLPSARVDLQNGDIRTQSTADGWISVQVWPSSAKLKIYNAPPDVAAAVMTAYHDAMAQRDSAPPA